MSRSSSPLFSFEWMFPLIKEQLFSLHQQLQHYSDAEPSTQPETTTHADKEDLLVIAESYQQIHSKLDVAGLKDFTALIQQLVTTINALSVQYLPLTSVDLVLKASEQLLQEFSHYIDLGSYQQQPLQDSLLQLQQLFTEAEVVAMQEQDMTDEHKAANNAIESLYPSSSQPNSAKIVTSLIENDDQPPLNSRTDTAIGISTNNIDKPAWILLQPYLELLDIPSDADDCDPEIKEIFIEEAEEVLQQIAENLQHLTSLTSDKQALTTIRRGFHTLKGSGRMVGALTSAELAWAIENMLNRVLEGSIDATDGMLTLLQDVVATYPQLIDSFAQHTSYPEQVAVWMAAANLYANNQSPGFDYATVTLVQDVKQDLPPTESVISEPTAVQATRSTLRPTEDRLLDSLASANARLQQHSEAKRDSETKRTDTLQQDKALQQVFVDEAYELLSCIDAQLDQAQASQQQVVSDELLRAFHTLRGAASSQGLEAINEISAIIEQSLEQLQIQQMSMSDRHRQLIAQSLLIIRQYIKQHQNQSQLLEQQDLSQQQQALYQLQLAFDKSIATDTQEASAKPDIKLSIATLITGADTLLDAEWQLPQLAQGLSATKIATIGTANSNLQDWQNLTAYFDQLMAQSQLLLTKVGDSAQFTTLLSALQQVYQAIIEHPEVLQLQAMTQLQVVGILTAGHEQLLSLFDSLAGSMALKVDTDVIKSLHQLAIEISQSPKAADKVTDSVVASAVITTEAGEVDKVVNTDAVDVDKKEAVNNRGNETNLSDSVALELVATDPELLAIFIEEAQVLDDDSNQQFTLWQQDPQNQDVIQVLQRHLHTIKGGARMAGVDSIAELSHEAESLYECFVNQQIEITPAWVALMQSVQDVLSTQIEMLAQQSQSFYVPHIVEQLQGLVQRKQLDEGYQLPSFTLSSNRQQPVAYMASESVAEADRQQMESHKTTAADRAVTSSLPSQQAVQPPASSTASAWSMDTDISSQTERTATNEDISLIELEFDRMKSESWGGDSPDPDILAVFLEEADDLIGDMGSLQQHAWQAATDTRESNQAIGRQTALTELQRALHLLKGGAHMVNAYAVASVADALQAVYSKLVQQDLELPPL
ncbi:Hpt domain-containing protein [Psychrobacter lutiphocae]|uniref:Hpt domain-containing protein n=1 Tax=Psychrobacter lutiphocae TaxID=540500 RepID=UPI000360F056|nr:Hpt domain-containing protein [Psychrobacter lutiphocae]